MQKGFEKKWGIKGERYTFLYAMVWASLAAKKQQQKL